MMIGTAVQTMLTYALILIWVLIGNYIVIL